MDEGRFVATYERKGVQRPLSASGVHAVLEDDGASAARVSLNGRELDTDLVTSVVVHCAE